MYRVWQLVIEHMQVPMFETHHSIYLHKYLNMFDHQQAHPVEKTHDFPYDLPYDFPGFNSLVA